MFNRALFVFVMLIAGCIFECAGDCFFRTYDFIDGGEMFNRAIEIGSDSIAVVHCAFDSPFIEGIMLIDGEGDSLSFADSPASPYICCNDQQQFVLLDPSFQEFTMIWVDVFGNVVGEVDVEPEYMEYDIHDICTTSDGGYFISGEYFAVKVDQSGLLEWEYPDDYSCLDFFCVAEGADGSFITGGDSVYVSVFCSKLSVTGDLIWTWTTGDQGMRPISAIGTPDSGYVMGSAYGDIYKLSSEGDSLWHYEAGYTIWYSDIICSGDYLIACGPANDAQLSVMTKLDQDGNLLWQREYPDCSLGTVVEASDGGFILTGYSPKLFEYCDALVMKTDSEGWWGGTGIEPELHPNMHLELVVYPNPSSSNAFIGFRLETPENLAVSVFDIAGRCVLEIPETAYEPGYSEVRINDLGAGVYYCRVVTDETVATDRFVMLE